MIDDIAKICILITVGLMIFYGCPVGNVVVMGFMMIVGYIMGRGGKDED